MYSSLRFIVRAAIVLAAVSPVAAKANIIGDSLTISYEYSNTNFSNTFATVDTTVPGSVEIYSPSGFGFTATGSEFVFTFSDNGTFLTDDFGGFVITDNTSSLANDPFAYDAADTTESGYANMAGDISGNTVSFNFQGHGFTAGQQLAFYVNGTPTSATPEPSSFMLLGTGIVGLAGAARRRFKA